MSLFVVGDFFRQLGHKVRPFGSWAHKAHFSPQNIPKLGNLINANLAYDPANPRSSVVSLAGPHWPGLFRVHSHRAKLRQHKWPPVLTYSLLPVEDWTTRIKFDKNRSQPN